MLKKQALNLFCILICCTGSAQKVDSISIPKGVVYKYTDVGTLEKAKALVQKELGNECEYKLTETMLFVGPGLWSRYKNIKKLSRIEGGNMKIQFDNQELSGKLIQSHDDFKKLWDQVREDVKGKEVKLRKATHKELEYYWAVINFDIEEPLIIADTGEHRFILNLSNKDLHLLWLDEVPSQIR